MADLARRTFLLGTSAALVLAACGGDGDDDGGATTAGDDNGDGDGGATTTTEAEAVALALGQTFNPNTYLQVGIPQRAPVVLFQTSGGFATLDQAPAELTVVARSAGQEVSATVARHGDELDRPYYPVELTFPATGQWSMEVALADGTTLTTDVAVIDGVPFPQVGDPMPSFTTPTVANDQGVAHICTRTEGGPCPFHEVSLDDALAEGRPVAVLVSTPEYCEVAVCGPVLDLLVAANPTDLAVVHIEVFPNGEGADRGPVSPLVNVELELDFEPILFVADAEGTITARLGSIYDSAELATALQSALS